MFPTEVKWLAGFTSADGTITPMIKKQKDVSIGYNLSLRLSWGQKPEPILAGFFEGDAVLGTDVKKRRQNYELTSLIQFGNSDSLLMEEVSLILDKLEVKYGWAQNRRDKMVYINIYKFSQVKNLLKILFPYLLGVKRIQAKIMLEEIIPRMEQDFHKTKDGFLEIMEFIDKLNSLKGGKRGKYNRNFFKEVWNID